MASLIFGLAAALAWGLHDFFVRSVSQRAAVAPVLFVVICTGALLLIPVSLLTEGWRGMTPAAVLPAFASGLAYALACLGLYRAFAIGPVSLVAPICGAYPVLSVAHGALSGRPVLMDQWLAVLAVIGGVALVARQSGHAGQGGNRLVAILWASMGATAFALTFGLGQIAARHGPDLTVLLVSRIGALSAVALALTRTHRPFAPVRPMLPLLGFMGLLDLTALGMVVVAGGLAHPEYAAVSSSVFGVVTILLAWRFLDESLRSVQWAGVGLVFGGIGYLAAA
jgi:drug/metabolite transporter (DMT)-like permease